jgi:hypothetical protein
VTKYLITVSMATRHGRTNLHTFGKPVEAEHAPWMPETHSSRKQLKHSRTPLSPLGVANWPPPPRRDLRTSLYDELGDKTIDLADGADVSPETLTVILDALRSDQRHEVDLTDLKCVISQLGSRIAKLSSLSDEQRRHAGAQPELGVNHLDVTHVGGRTFHSSTQRNGPPTSRRK